MNRTTIEWTDYTWNPVTGCTKVSAGCRECYAETMAKRFWGKRKFTHVQMYENRLWEPDLNAKKWRGKKVFVCSMSDLFHPDVTSSFIDDVLETIHNNPDTIFQVLTKRPERALEMLTGLPVARAIEVPPNLWIGVSCENQETANERIPLLLQIPAAVRFLSCEPLLGPIDIGKATQAGGIEFEKKYGKIPYGFTWFRSNQIHWVIAGGESGRNARPMHPDWVRSLRDQCAKALVPFFFKQWGEYIPFEQFSIDIKREIRSGNCNHKIEMFGADDGIIYHLHKVGKSKSGNLLDGKQHLNFPTV